MANLRALPERIIAFFRGRRGKLMGICAAVALLLALLVRFGAGTFLGGSEMALVGTGEPRDRSSGPAGAGDQADPADGDAVADAAPEAAKPAGRGAPPSEDSFMRTIVPRSLFDSAGVDQPNDESESIAEYDPYGDCAKSDLSIELMVTMEALPMEHGAALLKGGEKSKEEPRVYQVGDKLTSDATLWAVYRRKIMLQRNDGRTECISLDDEQLTKRAKKTDKKKSSSRGGRHDWEGISKTGENEYEVSSDEVAFAMENVDRLSRDARITQYYKDGQRSGFRLSSIRRTGVFGKLGFQNNDVITSINGMSITSTNEALKVYESLQNEKSFTVDVLRRGQPATMKYSIR